MKLGSEGGSRTHTCTGSKPVAIPLGDLAVIFADLDGIGPPSAVLETVALPLCYRPITF